MKEERHDMFYGASWIIHKQARELRHRETRTEKILWSCISNRKMKVKFRRQHPINQFIADFYSHEVKLVIEIDGSHHLSRERKEYDDDRTKLFNDFNITVIRFTNYQILNHINDVLEEIKKNIKDISYHSSDKQI